MKIKRKTYNCSFLVFQLGETRYRFNFANQRLYLSSNDTIRYKIWIEIDNTDPLYREMKSLFHILSEHTQDVCRSTIIS